MTNEDKEHLEAIRNWFVRAKQFPTDKRNQKGLRRALKLIYKNQTDQERVSNITKEENGVGFNKSDARHLSGSLKIITGNHTQVYTWTFWRDLADRLQKYSAQLIPYRKEKLKKGMLSGL